MKNHQAKQKILDEIQIALLKEIEFIRLNPNKTTEEKVIQVDVLFDTIKFLRDYDENIRALNQYLKDKKFEGR